MAWMHSGYTNVRGVFTETSVGNRFEYRVNDTGFQEEEFPYLIAVGPCNTFDEFRYAKILKTVAYVSIDEDAEGKPIVEKWDIKKHYTYPTN